ncbi:hypothetical protein Wcon_00454 [Wolbachia endosymbiont of Cylisticus convexus]|nr:hypothetical protein Wcon_00454 [Wolbachia endosymbiont of Cylisticus convexus]
MVEYSYNGNPSKCISDCRTDFLNHKKNRKTDGLR